MTENAYDELNEQDRLDLEEWIDESQLETEKLLDKVCEGVEIPSEGLGASLCAKWTGEPASRSHKYKKARPTNDPPLFSVFIST